MKITICIDWDGTLVDHAFPDMGKPVPYAWETLRWLRDLGFVELILLTMRAEKMGANLGGFDYLNEAIVFAKDRDIIFDYVNENPSQKEWTDSAKIYGSIYIDDTALGTPLVTVEGFNRPCVDWKIIRNLLENIFKENGFF